MTREIPETLPVYSPNQQALDGGQVADDGVCQGECFERDARSGNGDTEDSSAMGRVHAWTVASRTNAIWRWRITVDSGVE